MNPRLQPADWVGLIVLAAILVGVAFMSWRNSRPVIDEPEAAWDSIQLEVRSFECALTLFRYIGSETTMRSEPCRPDNLRLLVNHLCDEYGVCAGVAP